MIDHTTIVRMPATRSANSPCSNGMTGRPASARVCTTRTRSLMPIANIAPVQLPITHTMAKRHLVPTTVWAQRTGFLNGLFLNIAAPRNEDSSRDRQLARSGDAIHDYRLGARLAPGFCRRSTRPSLFSNRLWKSSSPRTRPVRSSWRNISISSSLAALVKSRRPLPAIFNKSDAAVNL